MRYLLMALGLLLALLYFTVGVCVGYVTLTRTYLWNTTGQNTYTFRTLEDGQRVGVTGSCQVKSGTATIRLFNSSGTQVDGRICTPAPQPWALEVMGAGPAGLYRLTVDFQKFTGNIDLRETLRGR